MGTFEHIPIGKLNEKNIVILTAPSKTFNLAASQQIVEKAADAVIAALAEKYLYNGRTPHLKMGSLFICRDGWQQNDPEQLSSVRDALHGIGPHTGRSRR